MMREEGEAIKKKERCDFLYTKNHRGEGKNGRGCYEVLGCYDV